MGCVPGTARLLNGAVRYYDTHIRQSPDPARRRRRVAEGKGGTAMCAWRKLEAKARVDEQVCPVPRGRGQADEAEYGRDPPPADNTWVFAGGYAPTRDKVLYPSWRTPYICRSCAESSRCLPRETRCVSKVGTADIITGLSGRTGWPKPRRRWAIASWPPSSPNPQGAGNTKIGMQQQTDNRVSGAQGEPIT